MIEIGELRIPFRSQRQAPHYFGKNGVDGQYFECPKGNGQNMPGQHYTPNLKIAKRLIFIASFEFLG
jgi:hypothetical protein